MTAPNRTRHTPARLALLALGAILLGACDPGPVVSPSPSGASPAPSGPPTTQTLSDALKALDGLASYRFVQSVAEGIGGSISQARGVVVNGTERRTKVEYTAGGAFAGGQITIGNRTWVSVSGAAYLPQDDPAGPGGTDWINPVARAFDPWALGLDEVEDLGVSSREGVEARHLRSTATADPSVDEDGLPTGTTFTGTADTWIAVDGGYLVAATASGTQAEGAGDGTGPSPSPSAYSLDVVVEGVDDPANAVDAPGSAAATPSPGGDPAAAEQVRGIAKALARLDSYVFTITATTGGMETTGTLTVVNATKAARVEYGGIAGFDSLAILVVGDRAWSRVGAGPWTRGAPTCGTGGDTTAAAGRCTFARLVDVGAGLQPTRGTFTLVAEEERAAGIASTHLRSDAGLDQAGFTIPGTWDVWIANDGGYPVQAIFTGEGLSTSMVISRVDDPANTLQAPSR